MNMRLQCADIQLDLSYPRIMGIVNVTPDSFSDGGRHATVDAAVAQAHELIDAGADIVDIGGESTRPGAESVSVDEELARVIPVIAALRGCGVVVSVDTRKPEVMCAAIAAGAHMVNDVEALQADGALEVVAQSNVALCLMHMPGNPKTMQALTDYDDVVVTVTDFLKSRIALLLATGIASDRVVIDPGFGFGKNLTQNLQLLKHLDRIVTLNYPVLVGMSRKSMLGLITGRSIEERLAAGLAAHLYAVKQGANIIRVHDVAACRDALTVWKMIGDVA
ncbi:dihydropteroate synthase [Sulfuriferula nivalis]|uniref:Dihydropteroate synthase n=1 Tax=Sulfuriferula nivalis TaxID=2675298 RepID=A0A809S4E6_9PROT|nr:dihydropteroate synthase [Sulfuriferula nivalis]BBP01828.1 dihydropteroate synthase [Sulfuriferula nivalis]